MKRVVVIGGGFAGLHLIRYLAGRIRADEAEVTLIDRNNFHLFTPLLYQVATGELPPHAVAYPLRVPLARHGFRFVRAEVEGIDLAARVAGTSEGQFPYDHLILVVFEEAGAEPDAAKRKELLSFAVVGAGPVGVELSASMRDLMDHTLRPIYPTIDMRREPSITLIDGADRVVPKMDRRLSEISLRRLRKLGTDV